MSNHICSRTCHYERPGFQDALGPVGSGDFLSDTFVLGGVTMPNMTFGYTSRYSFPDRELAPVASILGMNNHEFTLLLSLI